MRRWAKRRWSSAALALLLASASAAPPSSSGSGTLAYVIANFNNAVYETQFMDECPQGPAVGNDELWWRGLSRPDKDKLTDHGLV